MTQTSQYHSLQNHDRKNTQHWARDSDMCLFLN